MPTRAPILASTSGRKRSERESEAAPGRRPIKRKQSHRATKDDDDDDDEYDGGGSGGASGESEEIDQPSAEEIAQQRAKNAMTIAAAKYVDSRQSYPRYSCHRHRTAVFARWQVEGGPRAGADGKAADI